MKAVLDACVMYPTVMREVLLASADRGFFEPLWSETILREWLVAAGKRGALEKAQAQGDQALLKANWQNAQIEEPAGLADRFYLPDPNDRHVLATAVGAGAPVIITMNLRDFPARLLAEHGISAIHPDALLRGFFEADPERMRSAVELVRTKAEALSGEPQDMRKLMKKARMPRLGKALAG
ncbi:MAG: PIN domain-containing protein [Paracoccaceae bacterium]|nr:PIN domain-containing protein [Paracoccaceae bacterium]